MANRPLPATRPRFGETTRGLVLGRAARANGEKGHDTDGDKHPDDSQGDASIAPPKFGRSIEQLGALVLETGPAL